MGNSFIHAVNELPDDQDIVDFTVDMDIELGLGHGYTHSSNMPVIRKKPTLEKFQQTPMYKEIKARCALSTQEFRRPNLLRVLQQRENGINSNGTGAFTTNQQRSIANLFIPNQKSARLMSLDSKVYVCKFNRNGSKLLVASQDGYIRIYDSSKGTYHMLKRISAHGVQWSVLDADFSPNGEHFVYCSWSQSFFIIPTNGTADGCQWIDVDSHSSRVAIFSVRYSPTGDKIIGGSNHSSVIIGDVQTRSTETLRTHRVPSVDVNSVSYLHDKDPNVIIAGCDDGLLKVYDLRTSISSRNLSKCVSSFIGHYDGITYIDSRNDGYYVLTNSKDQSVKVWDMRQPSNLRFRSSARQQQLEMSSWDYRWDKVPQAFYNPNKALDGDSSVMTYRGHRVSRTLLRAKFSPLEQTGQRYIYTGCATGRIIIYDVLTGKIKEAIEGHRHTIRDLDWHPDRSEIVSGSWDTHVHLNTFKRNMVTQPQRRRRSSMELLLPLRRSRRLAKRNSTPY